MARSTAALALAAVACSGGSSGATTVKVGGEAVPVERLEAAAVGVCQAAGQAASDAGAPRRTFFGKAHDGLHTIARALEDVDRRAAADLLQAKQTVEADLSGTPTAADLGAHLRRLAAVTQVGLDRLDIAVPPCEAGPQEQPDRPGY